MVFFIKRTVLLLLLSHVPGLALAADEVDVTNAPAACKYHQGTLDALIIGSTLLLPDTIVEDGGLILSSGKIGTMGKFDELAVSFPDASRLDCRGKTLLSPGWVNVHEHEAFSYVFPDPALKPIYRHREEWIFGRNGMPVLPIPDEQSYDPEGQKNLAVLSWVELRHLFAGTTTLGGPGAIPGLAKNVGLRSDFVNSAGYTYEADLEIFPFSLDAIEKFADVCKRGSKLIPSLSVDSQPAIAYAPHVGEGRKDDCTAKSEMEAFLSYVAAQPDRRFSAVHAVAAGPDHLAQFSKLDVTLVWSPRSNLNLYGETINLLESKRQGVRLALATDWSPSGSFNMLEELGCAQAAAQQQDASLDAHQLWMMATHNAAYAVGIDDAVGQLKEGLHGDIILLQKGEESDPYAAAINAAVEDVLVVWVDGSPTVANSRIARLMDIDSDCTHVTASDKVICADFETLGIAWEDIVALTTDAVPINGDTSRQSSCEVTNSHN